MITIDLGGSLVPNAILIGLAIFGFVRGFRYMVSIALFQTIGYMLTVQSGNFLVSLINRFYSNSPKVAAFVLGRDPASIDALGPIIPDNFQSPLLLRVLVFIALLAVGIGYAWPWEGTPLKGFQGERPMRILGALTGLYAAVLGISAIATFWADSGASVNFAPPLTAALNSLPNYLPIIPSAIAAFAILIGIILLLRFPLLLKPAGGGGGGGGGGKR
jgi:hypothetical protein